jgi:hypothetical protein
VPQIFLATFLYAIASAGGFVATAGPNDDPLGSFAGTLSRLTH